MASQKALGLQGLAETDDPWLLIHTLQTPLAVMSGVGTEPWKCVLCQLIEGAHWKQMRLSRAPAKARLPVRLLLLEGSADLPTTDVVASAQG